ncbi:MAG: DUF5659 domain-containing protein [Cellulosilyticaceae bacterium]
MKQYETIHSIKLAMHLIRCGYDIVKVVDNFNDPTKKVFIFVQSKELSNAIKNYNRR